MHYATMVWYGISFNLVQMEKPAIYYQKRRYKLIKA